MSVHRAMSVGGQDKCLPIPMELVDLLLCEILEHPMGSPTPMTGTSATIQDTNSAVVVQLMRMSNNAMRGNT